MKKKLLLILAGVSLILFSCAPVTTPVVTENGTIEVRLPIANAKDINITDAATYSNVYEVLIYNATYAFAAEANSTDESLSFSVAPGTYKVLILAGYKSYSSDSYPSILGSGVSGEIVVAAGQRAKADITLKDIDFTLTAPTKVSCGYNYTVSVAGDTKNPVLQVKGSFSVGGASITLSKKGQQWEGNGTAVAPATAESKSLGISISYTDIYVSDSVFSRNSMLFSLPFKNYWSISSGDLPTVLKNKNAHTIEFTTDDATGLDISAHWGF